MRAVASLRRHLREIVSTEMVGMVSWDADVLIYALMPAEKKPRERQRLKEMAVIGFPKPPEGVDERCRFELGATSSEENPPLGRLRLMDREHTVVDGPLNQATSKQIGAYIRNSFIDRDSGHERSER